MLKSCKYPDRVSAKPHDSCSGACLACCRVHPLMKVAPSVVGWKSRKRVVPTNLQQHTGRDKECKLELLVSGLVVGAIYGAVGIGYNIVLIGSGKFNFAEAQIIMVSSFIAYVIASDLRLNIYIVIVICGLSGALVGIMMDRVAVRPLRGRRGAEDAELITTLGLALALEGLAQIIWGSDPLTLPYFDNASMVHFDGAGIYMFQIGLVGLTIVGAIALALLYRKTNLGLKSRAASEDLMAAAVRGINISATSTFAFGISGLFLGLLAVPVAGQLFVVYNNAEQLAVFAFVVIAIGGFESILGALFAGLALGLVEAYVGTLTNSNVAGLVVFVLFIVFLLVLPGGIFKVKSGLREV